MPQYTKKPREWFIVNEQARKTFSETSIRELMLSMEEHGQLQPVGAKGDGTLIWGERRLRAAMMSQKIKDLIVCITEDLTENQFRVLQLTENLQREDLTSYEKWIACAELMCANPDWKQNDLAAQLHIDPSTVTRLLSPSQCIAAAQDAFKVGRVGLTDMYALSKAGQKEQHELLAAKLNGASRDDLERQRRRARPGNHESVRSARVSIPMPTASVTITGADLSMATLVQLLGDVLKEAKKAADTFDVKTWQAMMRDRAKGTP